MFIGYIYKTTNLINNRCYIGKKNKNKFDQSYYGSGVALQAAIKKYGKENFKVEVLHWATSTEELNKLEINSITEYKDPAKLYNIAKGGDGGDTTTNNPNRANIIKQRRDGVIKQYQSLTEEEKIERRKKISESKKGRPNGHSGMTHSAETISKMKEADKSYTKTKKWKDAHSQAMSKRQGNELTKKFKPVIVNNVTYPSIKHAMEALGIKHRATFYDRINRNIIKVEYI